MYLKKLIYVALFICTACSSVAALDELDTLKWTNRVILLDLSNDRASVLHDELMLRKAEVIERDLVVFCLETNGSISRFPPQKTEQIELSSESFKQRGVTAALIGKDGFEKLHGSEISSAESVFKVIDSMPMRKNEIKKDKQSRALKVFLCKWHAMS